MTLAKITALTLAGFVSIATAAAVFAATPLTAEQAVAARQAAMKQDGRILRGASSFTGDKAVETLQTVHDNYVKLPSLFIENSITDKSLALPVVWERFDEFTGIFKHGAEAAAKGIAAAKAGDTAGYKAAVQTVAETCNTCHDTFREKLM
jgi:cytochrome c556